MPEDDGEFKPNESTISNLTSLFDSNKPQPGENHSLTYNPPKAPRSGESFGGLKQSGSKGSSNKKLKIITSSRVQVYKLEGGKYVSQGTAGVAILGNHDLHLYQVILYKKNTDILCKTPILLNFSLTVLQNNYVSFYDNSGQNWSILFSSPSNVYEFAKRVAIAKYNSQINDEKIIVQDLLPISGTKVKEGDVIRVAYICSVLENDEVVPWREKETESIELTDVNVFPWHEGLRDLSEHIKRIVVIPHKLSAPWTNDINKNACVVMELETISITSSDSDQNLTRKGKDKRKSDEGDRDRDMKSGEESVKDKGAEDECCKGKTTLVKESVFLSRSQKVDLISRIAKIGQSYPVNDGVSSGPSDSEDECTRMPRGVAMRLNSMKNAVEQLHRSLPIHVHQCAAEAGNSRSDNSEDVIRGNDETSGSREQKKMRIGVNAVRDELKPCQNAKGKDFERDGCSEMSNADRELRTSIDKLSEKVDEIFKKLENLECGKSKWDGLKKSESGGETAIVSDVTGIRGAIEEIENLKTEMKQQRRTIDEQNKKIETLTDSMHRCVEKYSVGERKRIVEKGETKCSEEELRKSEELRGEGTARINASVSEELCRREKSAENEREIDYVERKLVEKEVPMCCKGEVNEEMLNCKTEDAAEIYCSSKAAQNIPSEDSSEELKRVMNAVNRKLQGYFEPDMNYSGSEVKEIITSTIKDVTVEYLKYKSKLRSASGMDLYGRDNSERGFEERRKWRTEGAVQEPGSPHRVKDSFDSDGSAGQTNFSDFTKVTLSGLALRAGRESAESGLDAEKSRWRRNEMVSSRSDVSPEARVSKTTWVTGDDSYGRDEGGGGKKSVSETTTNLETSSRTRQLRFAGEDENFRESGGPAMESSATLNATEESVMGSSSGRWNNAEMALSENHGISREEIFVGSESSVECKRDENVETENYDYRTGKGIVDAERLKILPSPSQKRTLSIGEEEVSGSGEISPEDFYRLKAIENVVDIEDREITESLDSSVWSATSVRSEDEESRLDEGTEGYGLFGKKVIRTKSEISGIDVESRKSGINLKDERARESASFRSISRVRNENWGVNTREEGGGGVEYGKIEKLAASLTGRGQEKESMLIEPLASWTEKEGKLRDAGISGGSERDIADRGVREVREAGRNVKMTEKEVETDGIASKRGTSNSREVSEIGPFSATSIVSSEESPGRGNDEIGEEKERQVGSKDGECEEGSLDLDKKKPCKENRKSSGSNSANDDSLFTDYCEVIKKIMNWVLSEPPPLPLDEDEDDEEWL